MRAVVVDPSLARTGRSRRPVPAVIDIRDVPTPVPPAPGWVRVRPTLAGICVSDLDLVAARSTPTQRAAFGAPRPTIPGHEVVGVVEATHRTRHAQEGMRVVIEPRLACRHKGLPECARCAAGEWHLCDNRDRSGPVCSGHGIGFNGSLGGGWSEGVVVHEDMLVPIGTLPDQRAVLAEPTATAIQTASHWNGRGDRVVVLGSGARSRLLVATLARLYPGLDITVVYDARRGNRDGRFARTRREIPVRRQVDFAGETATIQRLGANRVWRGPNEQLLEHAASHLNARLLRAGGVDLPILDLGFDAVFDCRTTEASLDLSLRLLRAGGTLVTVGRPGRHNVDWSLVWDRQLTIVGASGHGSIEGRPALAIARDFLMDTDFPVDGVITHRFPLEDVAKALETAHEGAAVGAAKIVLQTGDAQILTRTSEDAGAIANPDTPLLGAVAARVRGDTRVGDS